jgi:RNA polymerase sigma factor (sigma-70 family)
MDALTQQIVEAQTGDRAAYTHIVRHFQDMAVGYAYALVKDVHLAQDVAQEAFIDAYLHLSQLREPDAFAGWFRTVVFKHANRIHRKHRSPVVDVDKLPELADPTSTPDKVLEQRETQDQIQAALHSLPDLESQIATLFYISDYSRQQIADFLQMPIKSVIYRLKSPPKNAQKKDHQHVQRNAQRNRTLTQHRLYQRHHESPTRHRTPPRILHPIPRHHLFRSLRQTRHHPNRLPRPHRFINPA